MVASTGAIASGIAKASCHLVKWSVNPMIFYCFSEGSHQIDCHLLPWTTHIEPLSVARCSGSTMLSCLTGFTTSNDPSHIDCHVTLIPCQLQAISGTVYSEVSEGVGLPHNGLLSRWRSYGVPLRFVKNHSNLHDSIPTDYAGVSLNIDPLKLCTSEF